jgi:hypothetical protein
MGLMQGKVMGDTLVIMDSFALPVQGTETRVNAANEANEYMVQYLTESERVGAARYLDVVAEFDTLLGRPSRERDWVVPFTSRIWLLAIRYRRQHSDDEPEVPGPFRCCRGMQ